MIGTNGKDLNEYLLFAEWVEGSGLTLHLTEDSYPYVRTGESITIGSKDFLVNKCSIINNEVIAEVRGLKFELIHFRRLNKCH